MSEDYLIRNCAPTLAGLKTASMFTCPCPDRDALSRFLRNCNRKLTDKGLRLLPLRFSENKVLLYLYRPARLRCDLKQATASALLRILGYDPECCEKCIVRLTGKLQDNSSFPHEIGLFLGYPPEDVRGFIQHGPDCAKCTGCWKVYTDVAAAQKTFAQYKKCSRIYQSCWEGNKDLERLAVPTRSG